MTHINPEYHSVRHHQRLIDHINLTVLNVNALYGMFQSQLYYIFLFQIGP